MLLTTTTTTTVDSIVKWVRSVLHTISGAILDGQQYNNFEINCLL